LTFHKEATAMSKAPPIPEEQRGRGPSKDAAGAGGRERRDDLTGVQSAEPGDADVNLDQQGRYGNIRQNLTPQRKVHDR
jgi:hypothetical protein